MLKFAIMLLAIAFMAAPLPAFAEKGQPKSCEAKCHKLYGAAGKQGYKREQCLLGCRMDQQKK